MDKRLFILCTGFLCLVWIFPFPVCGMEKEIPPAVRLVLSRISPMLKEKAYLQAVTTLEDFIARGGVPGKPDVPDPKGYQHPEVFFTLGNCYLLMEDYRNAARAYEQALERDPAHSTAWLNLAKSWYELGRMKDAGTCFYRGYQSHAPKNPEHLYYSAAAYLMAKENARAIQLFEELFSAHPEAVKPRWRENLVHGYLLVEKPEKALPHIRRLAEGYTGEKRIQWQEILLHQYMALGMGKHALSLAEDLTHEYPGEKRWWKALAHIHLREERYEHALSCLVVMSFVSELSEKEKQLVADLHLQVGIPEKAVPLYKEMLSRKPDKEIFDRLVSAYQETGDYEAALDAILAYEKISGKTPELLMRKGEMFYELKHYDKAYQAFLEAIEKETDDPGRAWLMAGYAAMQTEDFNAGRNAFQKAAKYARQRKAALTGLNYLNKMNSRKKEKDS